MQPISNLLLEMFVLSKPYFDREGLIVAEDDEKVVGFIHVGFGPNDTSTDLSTDVGIICLLAVVQHQRRAEILDTLLEQGEEYLVTRGAETIRVGGVFPNTPFYLGVLGGSDLPGIHTADEEMELLFRGHEYQETGRRLVFERYLGRFRIPVDRRLVQYRRSYRLEVRIDQKSKWWDACVFGPSDRLTLELFAKDETQPCGSAVFWDMGPISTRAISSGMGLIAFEIDEAHRGKGLGTFIVSESLKQLQNRGVSRIEVQLPHDAIGTQKIFERLKFEQISQSVLFAKSHR